MLGFDNKILQAFDTKQLDEEVIEAIQSLCEAYKLSAEDVFYKWDAFTMTLAEQPHSPTVDHVLHLRRQLQQEQEKRLASFLQPRTASQSYDKHSLAKLMQQSGRTAEYPETPKTRKSFELFSSPSFGQSAFSPPIKTQSTVSFADRINKAITEDVFNDHVDDAKASTEPSLYHLSLIPGQQTEGYRYLYDKLTEKGELLDAQLEYFAQIICNTYSKETQCLIKTEEDDLVKTEVDDDPMKLLCHPGCVRHEPGLMVGRVCCDAIEPTAKLNTQSVVLESSRSIGGGCRVKLNLSGLTDGFALFPGQIIGIEATNPSGRVLEASRIFCPPLPPCPASALADIVSMYPPDSSAKPLHIVAASGPFTLDDNLDFEPLEALADDICTIKPDVVLLLGPFVDLDHSVIVSGCVTQDVDSLFALKVVPLLDRMRSARPDIKIVLVPSIRDAITEWIAFPQPPIASGLTPTEAAQRRVELGLANDSSGSLKDGIYLFPNPVQFRINEICIGVTTNDVLFDLNAVECSKQALDANGDDVSVSGLQQTKTRNRIERSFEHVLRHRSFYPIFPPCPGVCLDASRGLAITQNAKSDLDTKTHIKTEDGVEQEDDEFAGPLILEVTPDIMILPSKLRHVTKTVNNALCINPGYLVKGKHGGTYSRIVVHPWDTKGMMNGDSEFDGSVEVEHSVALRTRVEIKRI